LYINIIILNLSGALLGKVKTGIDPYTPECHGNFETSAAKVENAKKKYCKIRVTLTVGLPARKFKTGMHY
jgi:hypothetical protein